MNNVTIVVARRKKAALMFMTLMIMSIVECVKVIVKNERLK